MPVPGIIDDKVVDDIIWQYENAYEGADVAHLGYHREECARALGFIANPRGVPTILQSLQREGGHFSWQALQGISDVRFVEAINQYLDFTNQQDALPAIRSLAGLGEVGIPTLLCFVESGDRAMRREAVEALIGIGSPECLPILEGLAGSEDAELASKAGVGVLRIRCRSVDKIYQPPILVNEDECRLYHLAALAFPHDPQHEEDEVSEKAAELLASLGSAAMPYLRSEIGSTGHADTLHGPVYFFSERAAKVLKQIGEPAIPCLIDALCDEHGHVRSLAADVLGEITGRIFGPDYDLWSKWYLEARQMEQRG